jgi:hypothetical protein
MRPRAHHVMLAATLLGCAACDQDPFGRSERRVAGDYQLKQWEDFRTYYLVGGPQPDSGGGAINGTVLRLAWNDSLVLVQRRATFGGDTAWVVVDARRQTVSGPLTRAEVGARPELARLEHAAMPADSAWRILR